MPAGYAVPRELSRNWFELRGKRGLAGYGLARALRMLLDVLEGLSALQGTRTETGHPFVHGEVVPAMLRVDETGIARLIPLAPWHGSGPGTLPAPERCGHLAPERLLGDAIDARADVFSAGTLLWEALAGRRLFETDSVESIVMRLMGEKVTLPQLPPELSWAVPLKAVRDVRAGGRSRANALPAVQNWPRRLKPSRAIRWPRTLTWPTTSAHPSQARILR